MSEASWRGIPLPCRKWWTFILCPSSFIIPIPYDCHLLTNCIQLPYNSDIRRPLPSLGLRGAAPGITVGVRHGLWLHQCQLWLPRAAASVICQWLRNWCSFSGRRPSRTAMGPAKLFLSAFETATSRHVLAALTTLRCTFWRPPTRAEGWCQDVPSQARKHYYGPLRKHHGPRWPTYTALRPCKLFLLGFPLKASKVQKNPPLHLSKATNQGRGPPLQAPHGTFSTAFKGSPGRSTLPKHCNFFRTLSNQASNHPLQLSKSCLYGTMVPP